eukprot:TRINITY_DN3440_c0_g1_i1.p1 TRINITY_DN3440_c0_g1~~TRINITY_DN3440_c0_g1_i1.p1  ORF type:complete len:936 (-),score=215.39 TRINITY_DN3440_c0_g1_i1:45-2573(-)
MDFQAPSSTLAYKARTALNANYALLSTQGQAVVLIQGPPGSMINDSADCLYGEQLSVYLNNSLYNSPVANLIEGFLGPYFLPQALLDAAAAVPGGVDPRGSFANADRSALTTAIEYQMDGVHSITQVVRDFLAQFKPNCSSAAAAQYNADVTGFEAMLLDLNGSIESDTTLMDSIAVPIALFIFWFFLKNIKMLLLPLAAMLTSILYSSALMYPISTQLNVSTLAPTIMSSMCLAVSTDYTLFLLTRFNEERQTGKDIDTSVANMIYFAGHVIITSGMTLAVTFAAMLFYPTVFLQSFGAGTTIAILCSIGSNLVLSPTFLLCFPNFFTVGCCQCKRLEDFIKKKSAEYMESPMDGLDPDEDCEELIQQKASKWYRWVKFWDSPTRSIILIVVVLGLTLPVIYFLKDFATTTDSNLIFASNSRAVKVMSDLKAKFDPGMIAPYRVLVVAKNKTEGIITQKYWDISTDLFNTMNNSGLIGKSQVMSITSVQGHDIPVAIASDLLDGTDPTFAAFAPVYQFLADQLLNENRTAALTTIIVDFDPMSRAAEGWIASVRGILANFSTVYPDHEFYFYGGAVEVVDLVNSVISQFPYMVLATCVILFFIVGITFRSVLIPIRGLFTIGLSVAWTFGLAVVVFQKALNTPIFWFTPVFAFSIVVGLGLDYDIFLISRIHEYRDAGFNTQAAIVKGTYLTGSIITGAGLIMMIAFVSLSVSHVELIVQFAVVLTSAVFLDTFVVRTALVPAIMRLCSWANWWPSKYGSKKAEAESGIYTEDYFLDEEGEDDNGDKGDKFVKPHDLAAFLYRKRAVADIIASGAPSCKGCCKKKKGRSTTQSARIQQTFE